MGYPSLPSSVDKYVRQMLDTMAGRTGNLGDKVVTYNELAASGLLLANPGALNSPANANKTINDALIKPPTNDNGDLVVPDNESTEPPTTPKDLKSTGIFGAIILEWLPPTYNGHSHTEIHRAQINDLSQATMTHQATSNSYTDIASHGTTYYYWIRHVNDDRLKSQFNQVAGTPGQATADPTVIQEAVQGEIDNSYFTPGWAAHTEQQEQKLSRAEQDLLSHGERIGSNESSITALDQTTQDQAQSISQLETSDGNQNTKITTLEQTTANQAIQLTSLTSTVDDNTAAINEQRTVTDGLKAEYTLKVTQEGADGKPIVSGIGVASGKDEDGNPFSEIAFTAENFFFASADGLHQPFSIVNVGSIDVPDYKISMNADVLINGNMNISQLESGELKPGTALTVGQNSIELSTASDGTGQLIIAGDGGIQNNDYMIMNAGRIQAYVFVPGVGHVPYKEVKRVETGTANSGQQVKIPAYFRGQPTIHLYPRDMSVYNADYPNQSQKIEMYYSAPQPHPTEDGAWLFTPYAKLVLASGTETVSPGWTYAGSSNSQTWTTSNISNLKGVTVYCRTASYRRTTGTTYQNRQVTVYLDYKLSSSSTWSVGDSEVVSINQFTTHTVQLSKTLSQNQYDLRVRFVAADRSGTFNDGNPTYDYTSRPANGTPHSKTYSYLGNSDQYKKVNIGIDMPGMSGWEVTSIAYRYVADMTIRVRYRYYQFSSDKRLGRVRVKLPDSGGAVKTYEHTASSQEWNWREYTYANQTFTIEDNSYKDGQIRPEVNLFYTGGGYTSSSASADFELTSELVLNIKSISATVYYRRQQSNPQTYNNYYMDSARYDKSATDISLDNAVVTWMATSDN